MTDVETRRKRLLFRSWHRGTKETDLLLGSFAEQHLPAFSSADSSATRRCSRMMTGCSTTGPPAGSRRRPRTTATFCGCSSNSGTRPGPRDHVRRSFPGNRPSAAGAGCAQPADHLRRAGGTRRLHSWPGRQHRSGARDPVHVCVTTAAWRGLLGARVLQSRARDPDISGLGLPAL